MERLIILGAGGSSQQIAGAIEDINLRNATWELVGFLDDDPTKLGETIGGLKVLGPMAAAKQYSARFICGIASARDPRNREMILTRTGLERDQFATVIHPSASVSRYAQVGLGTAILQNVVITQNTVVGDHVLILQNVSIGHDVTIEDFVTVAPGAIVTGHGRLRTGAYLGAGCRIKNGLTVGEGAVVGFGSAVAKNVPPGVTVFGNPARPLASRRQAQVP